MTHRHQPGLAALTAFFGFGTVMAGLTCLALLLPETRLTGIWRLNPVAHEALAPTRYWSAALMCVVAVACAVAAVGLWIRRRWGLHTAIALLVVNLIGDIVSAIVLGDRRTLIGVPIAAVIIGYLLRGSTRRHFMPGHMERNDVPKW